MFRFLTILLLFLLISEIESSCPNGSYEWQTECYFFQTELSGFPDAEAKCISIGGHLASVHDGFTNALITEQAGNYFTQSTMANFWIGLNDLLDPGNLTWIDYTTYNFFDWDSNQPQNKTGTNCGAINLDNGGSRGRWTTQDCYLQKPYVCEINKSLYETTTSSPIKCPGNFSYYEPTDSCYGYFFTTEYDAKNWTYSETFCQSMNGHLASFHDSNEQNFIMSFNFRQNTYYSPWIGLFSLDGGQTWLWSDGSPTDYIPWETGNPIPYENSCVFISAIEIANLDCENRAAAVCKTKPTETNLATTTVKSVTTTTTRKPITPYPIKNKCSGNFTYYEPTNSCYAIFFARDDGKNWTDAEAFCKSLNGHLASIHSKAELQFIKNLGLLRNTFQWPWVGLYSPDNATTWRWSDGSSADNIPWDSSYPVASFGNCALGQDQIIYNYSCYALYGSSAVCKIKSFQ